MDIESLYKTEVTEVAESMSKSERTDLIEGVIRLFRDEPNNTELGKSITLLVKRIVGEKK